METTASIAEKRKFLLNSTLLRSLCYKYWRGGKNHPVENQKVTNVFINDILTRRKEHYRVIYKLEDFRNPHMRKLASGLLLFYWYRRCCGGWSKSGLVHPSFRFEIVKTRKPHPSIHSPKRYATGSMLVEEFIGEILSEIVRPDIEIVRTDHTIGGTDYSLFNTRTQTWVASLQVKEYVFCSRTYRQDVFGKKVSSFYLKGLGTRLKRKYTEQRFFLVTPEVLVDGKRGNKMLEKLERKWDGFVYLWMRDLKDKNTVRLKLHGLNKLTTL